MGYKIIYKYIGLLLCLVASQNLFAQSNDTYLVIVNESVNNSIKKKEINAYLKGERNYWPNGNKVVISLPSPKSELADIVAQSIFKTNITGMQKYWLALIFQGRVDPPNFIMTDEETIAFVKSNNGALGIIHSKNKLLASDLIIKFKD